MSRRQDTARRGRRPSGLDGWAWIVVWALAVLAVSAVIWAPAGQRPDR